MNWYIEALKKYAVFNGRARRKEYWMFFLFNMIIGVVLETIVLTTGSNAALWISYIYSLAFLLPSLAVIVRRLHDTGKSGANIFFVFIPIVGVIILLVFLCKDSEPRTNQYGESPKETAVPYNREA